MQRYAARKALAATKWAGKKLYSAATRRVKRTQTHPLVRGITKSVTPRYMVDNNYFDYGPNSASITTTPTILSLCTPVQGSSTETRERDKITATSLQCHLTLTNHPSSLTPAQCRVIIGIDRQSNGAAPVVTDVLDSNHVFSFKKRQNSERFLILRDHSFHISARLGSTGPPIVEQGLENNTWENHDYIKINNTMRFTGNAGTVADVATGNIFFLAFCDIDSNAPALAYNFRTTYSG